MKMKYVHKRIEEQQQKARNYIQQQAVNGSSLDDKNGLNIFFYLLHTIRRRINKGKSLYGIEAQVINFY